MKGVDVFLSYARLDREPAESVADVLRGRGWSVWIDSAIRAGEYWDESIDKALRAAKCVVVLWSKNSIESHWVKTEAEHARQRGILIPVRIDQIAIPYSFARVQTVDLSRWTGDGSDAGLDELIDGIERLLGGDTAAASKIVHSKRRQPLSRSSLLGAFLLVVATALGALTFVHRAVTPFSLEATVTGVTLMPSRAEVFNDLLLVSQVAASEYARIDYPRTKSEPAKSVIPMNNARQRLVLKAVRGSLTLAPLTLQDGMAITLTAGQRHFRIDGEFPQPIAINVAGVVEENATNAAPATVDFGFPKPLIFYPSGKATDLGLILAAPVGNVLAGPLAIRGLAFTAVEERDEDGRTVVREKSTIRSGVLAIAGRETRLADGDKLMLGAPSGEIVRVGLTGEDLSIRFRGGAEDIHTCVDDACRDQRVTLLRWCWTEYPLLVSALGLGFLALPAAAFGFKRRRLAS